MTAPLLPGERLLWEGRPERGVPPDLSNPGSLVFGAAFAAFALFWMDRASADGPIWLAGLPFLALGLKLSVWKAWAPRLRARFARYAVTDRRVIAETRWPLLGTREQAILLTPATIVDRAGDPATLTLRQEVTGPRGTALQSLTLHRLEEGDHVLSLIRAAQRSAREGRHP